ncbi:MAG: FitA-like ribbon-helix-helix domain-containing protein [Actinomycetota bacterium]
MNIQIRDVPDQTHAVMRRRAAVAGMSMQDYLLARLNELAEKPTVEEVLARAGGRAGGRLTFASAGRDIRSERDRR